MRQTIFLLLMSFREHFLHRPHVWDTFWATRQRQEETNQKHKSQIRVWWCYTLLRCFGDGNFDCKLYMDFWTYNNHEHIYNSTAYTAKNAEPAAQQDWTMFCCPRCSHLSTILNTLNTTVEPESGVTLLLNIVDNCEQCGHQNIVQPCFDQYCNNLIFSCRV
jgi:hypothetical protein